MVLIFLCGIIAEPISGQQIKLASGAYLKINGANIVVNGKIDNAGNITNTGTTGLIVNGDITNSGTFVAGSANHSISGNWNNTGTFTEAGSTLTFNGSSAQTLYGTSSFNNLTVNNTAGLNAVANQTINGILYLQSANASSTKGSLDLSTFTLTMGANATTIGVGDVTGIIKRTSISSGITYSFGNQFTTIHFDNQGTLPAQMSLKMSIGTTPSWRSGALNREFEIIQTSGSATNAEISLHYLDGEVNSNNESHLVFWSKLGSTELGRSNFDMNDNWVSLTNFDIDGFSSSFDGTKNITLDEYSTSSNLVWNGSQSTSWTDALNWTPNALPSIDKNIIIPDANTTPNDPSLPGATEIKSLTIELGGIMNAITASELTINGGTGAWSNIGGTYNPSTSNVIFTNAHATLSGTTNFYDLTLNSGKILEMTAGSYVRIAGTMTNNGTWITVASGSTTVEYNGASQTIVIPDASTHRYYNLILSGSGTKTMPASAMSIYGNFTLSGTASVTAVAALTVSGNFTIGNGTSFITSTYSHSVAGNFTNNGTLTATASTISFNGSVVQNIGGTSTSTFENLTINNSAGIGLIASINVSGTLALTAGNLSIGAYTLGVNGAISISAGTLSGGSTSNIIIGGSGASTNLPSVILNNLTLNRSNGISLSGAVTIGGTLTLTSGTLTVGANTLTLAGNSPVRTSGNMNASNASATIAFTNSSSIALPASIFTGNVNNMILNGAGGVSLGSALTVAGVLTLTNGILTTTFSNSITVSNTAVTAISGGSTTSFVSGPIIWNLPASLSTGSTYVFPLGKSTTYLPMSVVDPTTGTGVISLTAEVYNSFSGGTADGTTLSSFSTTEYWALASSGNFLNSKVSLTRQISLPANPAIGRSTIVAGTYSSIAGTPIGNSIMNSNFTGGGLTQLFVIASKMVLFTVAGSNNADGTYVSLTNASGVFSALNASSQSGKNIVITVDGNSIAEAGTNSLNAGAWTTITMYPTTTGLTISGNVAGALINLNGADYVTIDGRVNQSGSADLTIANTNTGSSASTILFIESAQNNSIKYCTLKGSETSTTKGIVFFSTSSSGNGNDGNTIDNNNITADAAGRPISAIFSLGSSASRNNGNIICNNKIYNVNNSGTASNAVFLSSFTDTITVSGNSFYESSSFIPTADVEYNAIRIVNGLGNNFIVSGNYIGGQSALCGGSAWTKTNAKNNTFCGIYISVGTSGTSSIQNNTIRDFAWSNSGTANWTGINIVAGQVNVGTTTGNTIGAETGTASITITAGATGANVYGINIASSGTVDCENSKIGSITAANSDGTYATNFYGIYKSSTGAVIINNNTIGSLTTSNSIHASSTSTANAQSVFGIKNDGSGSISIQINTIANLTNGTTNTTLGTAGLIDGIASTSGSNTISRNTIRDLSISNANNSATETASVCGIALTGTTLKTLHGNSIYNLSNTYASFTGNLIGIYYTAGTGANVVANTFIDSLLVNTSSTSANLYGIKISAGATTFSNNIISLGKNSATTIYGIYETGASGNNNNIYFNTIYIGGSPTTGSLNSYALYSAVTTNSRNFRNNIFTNNRSNNGASGKHYAVYFNYTVNTNLTLDYNDYYAPGTGGKLGYYNSADVNTLPLVSGQDAYSLNTNPVFAKPGGTSATDYIPSSSVLAGVTISTIPTDYSSVNRAGTPTMGAFETHLSLNIDVYIAGSFQASYLRLKDAFDKINNGTHTGAIDIRIKASTTEIASCILYQTSYSGAGGVSNYSSVVIYPTETNITISGNLASALIELNNATNVTIDGRVNQFDIMGLVITNTNTGSASSTIRFVNSAENNFIRYCTLKGSSTNVSGGIIVFSSSSAGNGNDNNLIDNNFITSDVAGRPINAIYSSGTSGRENSSNTISDNNIYNFLRNSSSSFGINISSNSTDWNVIGNSLYETTTFIPTAGNSYYMIYAGSSANQWVSGNYIGGSQELCGGTAMTVNSSFAHYFCGIYATGGTGLVTTIDNNIIRNINYTSTQSNPWDGIYIASGDVDVTSNTIGATTGTGSITVTTPVASATATITGGVVNNPIALVGGGSGYTTPPVITFSQSGSTVSATATANLTAGVVTSITLNSGGTGYTSAPTVLFDGSTYSTSHGMIQASNGTVNILNNNIGSITTVGSNTYSHGFESVYVRSVTGTTTLIGNLIGSLSTANSIHVSSPAALSPQKQDVYGLYSASVGTTILSGNTIANLTNAYTGTNSASRTRGISTITGSNTIDNNTVIKLSTSSGQTGTSTNAVVVGISQTSTTAGTVQTVTANKVYDLYATHSTARIDIYGLYYSGPSAGANIVSGNLIHTLNVSSSNTACVLNGIVLLGGFTTCANNIISLGVNNTLGYAINGIWDDGASGNNNTLYYNSIYIGGAISSGVTSLTSALYGKFNVSTKIYKNNILFNARTGGTTGKHYAIALAGTANLTINYNDYYVTGTNGVLGLIATTDKTTLTAWKSATGQDVNSLNTNPGFTLAGGTSAFNYYSSASLPGIAVSGTTTDYSGVIRGSTPKMGALEDNNFVWQGGTSTDFGTASNWTGGKVPSIGANISFSASPSRNCVLDQDRIIGDITNAQSTYKFIVNGYALTILDSIKFTNSAQMDASTAGSSLVFAGTALQNIPVDALISNTIDTLSISNTVGLLLNNHFTVAKSLNLEDGSFFIGANTLTLNGEILKTNGELFGGESSNLIIGGSSVITSLPAVELNDLTINRSAGLNLSGDITIDGTLVLTSGTLKVNDNSLILKGSITKTAGFIDASNTSASLIFNNAVALTLPASVFSGSVNNMTINGNGGVTAVNDFTINGVLDLQSGNPTITIGALDMWDGSAMKTLTMGANATTLGIGDVTGLVKRTSFVVNTSYTFGSQFTTLKFASGGELPAWICLKIVLPSTNLYWKTDAVRRYYDFTRSGGNSLTMATLTLHYLEGELNGVTESQISIYDYHLTSTPPHVEDHGHSLDDVLNNWVGIGTLSLTYIARVINDGKYWFLGTSVADNFTWLGAESSDWNSTSNWVGGNVPGASDHVLIPDASTTTYDPDLPASTSIGSISILNGGIVNGGTGTELTITGDVGAWDNMGTLIPGTSTVIFTNAAATMSDPTNFYNVTVANGAKLTLELNNVMRIAGALNLVGTGILNAGFNSNLIEYNGEDQTIINPNGTPSGYSNLILSGSGTKTMPGSALAISGEFSTCGTATAAAGSALTIGGNVIICTGSTFITGAYNHSVGGNFENNGTFTTTTGNTIIMNGASAQTIGGSEISDFAGLTIDNGAGVTLLESENETDILTLTNGVLSLGSVNFSINGSITKTNGYLNVTDLTTLTFGGSSAITLPDDLFSSTPILNNLTINRSGGVTLGNQDITVNGLLSLTDGTLDIGATTLTIAGNSPVRTSGTIDADNANATLNFINETPIVLPSSVFAGPVNNLTVNGEGGITASSDLSVNGVLSLQSPNPSATKGALDLWDGSDMKTLTMGASATTIGMGDVTGIILRNTFTQYVNYSFGNEFTTISFLTGGTYPSVIQAKVRIGESPSWKTSAIERMYDFIHTGGSGCYATISTHYLHSELNGNIEEELVHWTNGSPGPPLGQYEWGRSNSDVENNWISISNINIAYFPTVFGSLENTLATSEITSNTWNGSQSTNWATAENWTPTGQVSSVSHVIIPDASLTLNSPALPSTAQVKTMTIQAGAVLNSSSDAQLTIYGSEGAWNCDGTFNPGTSSVVFCGTTPTISGTTNFNNITILDTTELWMTTGSIMRIAGSVTNNGIWHAVIGSPTTVEYNGDDQDIVLPHTSTHRYYNLILSGTGTKTFPASVLSITNDFTMTGSASATAVDDLTITGNVSINSSTHFTSGANSHTIGGNITNNGVLTCSASSTITCNGSTAQTIGGTEAISFVDLLIDNATGVTVTNDAVITVSGALTINSGKLFAVAPAKMLTCSGTVTNSAGASGFILHSNATGTASFIHSTADVPCTVERYISGPSEAWHFISSPVEDQSINGSWLPSGTYGNGTGYDLYVWNEPSSCWIYKNDISSTINWSTVHPGSDFVVGRGYLYSVQANAPTKEFIGNLNQSTVDYGLTISSTDVSLQGFNLVGNPYPSSVDWQASSGWTRTNLLTSSGGYNMWIWNPTANNYGVFNSFTGSGTNSVTRYIAPMQGYFVQAESVGDLGMTNDVRVHTGASNWFKESAVDPLAISLVVKSVKNNDYDEARLAFGFNANQSGAKKLFSRVASAPSIYLPSPTELSTILNLTEIAQNPIVPVSFKAGVDGDYTINCNFEANDFEVIILEDCKFHYFQDLKSKSNYSFHASSKDEDTRFKLHFGPDNTANSQELPANIYTYNNQLVIDLTLVSKETEVQVFDALGRLLMQKELSGGSQNTMTINAKSQILVVRLLNPKGSLCKKVYYNNDTE